MQLLATRVLLESEAIRDNRNHFLPRSAYLFERAFPGQMLSQDQSVNLMCPLICVDRLKIAHVPHDRVVTDDSISTKNASSRTRALKRHRYVVHLSHRHVDWLDLALVFQATNM